AYDVLLSKYTSSGSLIWNVSWGGLLDDKAYALDINLSSSNIYVVGRTASYGTSESNDLFLLSYDSSGVLLRNITWGGVNWDEGYDVKATSKFIFIVGYSNSFSSSEDIVLLKYNTSYALQWSKSYGTFEPDIGYGITTDTSDNIFLTGKTTLLGDSDLILMKLDSDGNQLWNSTWGGGSNTDEGRSLLINSLGEIFVLANTRSFGMGSTDFALIKFSSTGGFQWQRTWGGSDIDTGYKLVNDSQSNLFLIGYTESYGSTGKDACIIKYNSSGDYQWYKTRTEVLEDMAYSGYIDTNDNLYITGKSNNKLFLTKFTPLPDNFDLMHDSSSPDSDGTFVVYWSESIGAVNYSLYQSATPITMIDSTLTKIIEGNTNRTINFNNLGQGIYYYIVVAYNTYGNTTSDVISITVQYPLNQFALSHDADFPDADGTVNFTWTASQSADSYELYINNSLYKENITDNSYVVNNLDTNDYKMFVTAINEAGQYNSNEVVVIVRRIPSSFSLTTDASSPDTDGMFELIWTKSSYTSYYVLYNSSTFISEIDTSVLILYNFTPSLDLPTYRYSISDLNNGTYYYKIIAFNEYGNFSTNCTQITVSITPTAQEPEDGGGDGFIFPLETVVMFMTFISLFGLLIFVYIKRKKRS
ncbi:hypothetical protein LCGC14_1008370, partial [marine sediment metagenome]